MGNRWERAGELIGSGHLIYYRLRLTDRPDDFVIRRNARDVGRVYRSTFAGEERWQWTIYIDGGVPRLDGVPISGLAVSLEEAKRQFRESHDRMAGRERP